MKSQLNELARNAYLSAANRGFYNSDDNNLVDTLMHASSENGEAFKALKAHRYSKLKDFKFAGGNFKDEFEEKIKDSFEDEVADSIIILLSLCGYLNIDIDKHVELKMMYNKIRND